MKENKSSQNSVGRIFLLKKKRLGPQDGTPSILLNLMNFNFGSATTIFGSFNSNSRSTTKLASFRAAFRIQLLNVKTIVVARLLAVWTQSGAIQWKSFSNQVNLNKFKFGRVEPTPLRRCYPQHVPHTISLHANYSAQL